MHRMKVVPDMIWCWSANVVACTQSLQETDSFRNVSGHENIFVNPQTKGSALIKFYKTANCQALLAKKMFLHITLEVLFTWIYKQKILRTFTELQRREALIQARKQYRNCIV